MMRRVSLVFVSLVLVRFARAGSYDPLVVDPNFHPKVRDLTVHDAAASSFDRSAIYDRRGGKKSRK